MFDLFFCDKDKAHIIIHIVNQQIFFVYKMWHFNKKRGLAAMKFGISVLVYPITFGVSPSGRLLV